jgi:hypothetical protein
MTALLNRTLAIAAENGGVERVKQILQSKDIHTKDDEV